MSQIAEIWQTFAPRSCRSTADWLSPRWPWAGRPVPRLPPRRPARGPSPLRPDPDAGLPPSRRPWACHRYPACAGRHWRSRCGIRVTIRCSPVAIPILCSGPWAAVTPPCASMARRCRWPPTGPSWPGCPIRPPMRRTMSWKYCAAPIPCGAHCVCAMQCARRCRPMGRCGWIRRRCNPAGIPGPAPTNSFVCHCARQPMRSCVWMAREGREN